MLNVSILAGTEQYFYGVFWVVLRFLSGHRLTKRPFPGRLPVQEPEVEVGAPKQASKAQEKLLAQGPEPAETTLEVDDEAVELRSRNLVVVPTTAKAGLRLILQEQILRQTTRTHKTLTP